MSGPVDTYRTDGRERLLRGHSGHLFLLLTFSLFAVKLSQRLLPPLLPAIISDLAITAFLAGVALTLLRVARAGMEYPGGRFADQLSRKSVLVVCLVLVILGVTLLTISRTYIVFLIAVSVLGLGIGMFNPASRALLSDVFQEKRGRAFGFHMAGSAVAGIAAAAIAAWIVPITSWQMAFLPLLIGLILLPLALFLLIREPFRLGSVDLGLRQTGGRLLGNPEYRSLLVVYSLFVLASGGFSTFLPTFLIEVNDASFGFASTMFALIYAVGLVVKPLSGTVSDLVPRPLVAGGCLVVAAVGIAVLVAIPTEVAAVVGVVVYAVGTRSVPPTLQAYLMDLFPDESMGGDLGGTRAIYLAVGSFGPFYAGFMGSALGFRMAFVSMALFLVAGGAITLWFALVAFPDAR